MVMGNNGINNYKKIRQIDKNFGPHAAGAIWHYVHPPMVRIRGFMQSR
jgi:hypothetical protein